jgi:hypothetical protein
MRFSFRIGTRSETLGQEDRDLPDDASAKIEALLFGARILSQSGSGAEHDSLSVEVRGEDDRVALVIRILSTADHSTHHGDDEMGQEGEGHPS